jgi:hypothetical protein
MRVYHRRGHQVRAGEGQGNRIRPGRQGMQPGHRRAGESALTWAKRRTKHATLAALAIVAAVNVPAPSNAQDNPNRDTLKGLTGGFELVEDLPPDTADYALTKDELRTYVELSLRRSGDYCRCNVAQLLNHFINDYPRRTPGASPAFHKRHPPAFHSRHRSPQ